MTVINKGDELASAEALVRDSYDAASSLRKEAYMGLLAEVGDALLTPLPDGRYEALELVLGREALRDLTAPSSERPSAAQLLPGEHVPYPEGILYLALAIAAPEAQAPPAGQVQ